VPDSPSQPERSKQLPDSFEIPSALPSVAARVFAFSAILAGSLCGGLMGFALGRLQWGNSGNLWVFLVACLGSVITSVGVAIVAVLVLRAMSEWNDVASAKARRKT
jgi:hypothetical protein